MFLSFSAGMPNPSVEYPPKKEIMSSKIEKKLRLDERFSWSFAGVILALAFGGFALYAYYHQVRANIVFEIEAQSDVFDLHRPLQDLSLSFRGVDVQQQNLNLRIFTVRIWNKGGVDILQTFYDQQETWGLTFQSGQVVEVRVGQNNSQYLASHIDPKITSPDTVTLNKVILERDRFVTMDILVLHHKDKPPRIVSFGKIAGINEIAVIDASAQGTKPALIDQVLTGSPLAHLIRFVGYLVLLIACIFGIVGLFSLGYAIRRFFRRLRINVVLKRSGSDIEKTKILTNEYVQHGRKALLNLAETLKDKESLKQLLQLEKSGALPSVAVGAQAVLIDTDPVYRHLHTSGGQIVLLPNGDLFHRLVKLGLVKPGDNGDAVVDEGLVRNLSVLIDFLE